MQLDALRTRIVMALGLGTLVLPQTAGCGGRRIGGGEDSSGSGTGTSGSEESTETAEDSGSQGSDEETGTTGPRLDVAPDDGDTTSNPSCDDVVPDLIPEVEVPVECHGDHDSAFYVCFTPADGVACESAGVDEQCLLEVYGCGLSSMGDAVTCGPTQLEFGQCCYVVAGSCAVGRPLHVRGRARLAGRVASTAWVESADAVPGARELDAATRRALADAWAREGAFEHASVASFARFTLQMLSLGAPPDLVAAIQRATLEEIEHARSCFAIARSFAGEPVGPGALDVRGALDDEQLDPLHIAVTLAAEGCIAETVSAVILEVAAQRAKDPAVRTVLAKIAREEQAHVELAWRCMSWILPRADAATQRAVAGTFARAANHVGLGAVTPLPADAERVADYGYLSVEQRRRIASDTLRQVVEPIAAALLGMGREAVGAAHAGPPRGLLRS